MKQPSILKQIEETVKHYGDDAYSFGVKVPEDLQHLMTPTIRNYHNLPVSVQLAVKWSYSIAGKFATQKGKRGGFVFQMSHGTQQIKEYNPDIYKNDRNTPLRVRSRRIMHLAKQEAKPLQMEKLRELYRTYPYYLLKEEPVKLRMKNFYFDRDALEGDVFRIYQATDPFQPNPNIDDLYIEKEYSAKNIVEFEFRGDEEEHFYAQNERNGDLSNVLHFLWQESIS